MNAKTVLRKKLANLPKEPSKIARKLQKLGFADCDDAITAFVCDVIGDVAVVGATRVILSDGTAVVLPQHVRNFVAAFDGGRYPYLENQGG
jgi:hypothetical protein